MKDRIAYVLHAPVDEPAGRGVKEYMTRFADVEIVVPEGPLPPFPRSIAEVDQAYMAEVYEPRVAPLIRQTVAEVRKKGYGAVCTASFGDIGVSDFDGDAASPVVGLGWSNFSEARDRYGRFSIIHPYTPKIAWYFEKLVERYQMQEKCASIETYDVDLSGYITIGVRPDIDEIVRLTLPLVERAVHKGAEVVLFGCGGQFWSRFAPVLSQATAPRFGVEVLPPIDTLIQFARKRMGRRS